MKRAKQCTSEAVFCNDKHMAFIGARTHEHHQIRMSYLHECGNFPLEFYTYVTQFLFAIDNDQLLLVSEP